MSDKDETTPSLRDRPRKFGNSGILSVKYSPRHAETSGRRADDSASAPAVGGRLDLPSAQERYESGKIASAVARAEYARNVFKNEQPRACPVSQFDKFEGQVSSWVGESLP